MRKYYQLPRLYVPRDDVFQAGEVYLLSRDHSHYLTKVLRRKVQDQLRVFNERGGEWLADLQTVNAKSCEIYLHEQIRAPRRLPDIWLLFAPIRKSRMPFLIEKAVELGVVRLCPVKTQYSTARLPAAEKIRAYAREAAEQTERLCVPAINDVQPLRSALDGLPPGRILIVADEAIAGQPVKIVESPPPAAILVGPEGGFSEEERALIAARENTRRLSLGPRILRAETAALSALTLWQSLNGDWK